MSLSTIFRLNDDLAQAKHYLELVSEKSTDKRFLLKFYNESAAQLQLQNKHN
jgi:hypothetical protein